MSTAHDRRARLYAWIAEKPEHEGLTAREIIDVTGLYNDTPCSENERYDLCYRDLTALAAAKALARRPGRPVRWELDRRVEGDLELRPPVIRGEVLPPRTFDEVVEAFPTIRQSYLSRLDDCALALLFDLEDGKGWSNMQQAGGIIFHRFAAEALRTMQREQERRIPVAEALEILYEVLLQRDVPPAERVRIPLRKLPLLRTAVIKWASENEFNVDRIVSMERRLAAPIEYVAPSGELRTRTITGQIDLLVANPPDGASVVDWKFTWGLPPEPQDPEKIDATQHISYHGYFQQRTYGWLVMRNFPAVQRVTLREVYPLKGEIRRATLLRSDLEEVEREMSMLAAEFDARIGAGAMSPLWAPSPGKHCGFCLRPGECPIEAEARGEGAITDEDMARKFAAEYVVAKRVYKHRMDALKVHVDVTCEPVEIKSAKGRQVLGWKDNSTGNGRRFTAYVPDESDRGPVVDEPDLEAALRASAAAAEAEAVQGAAKTRTRVA